jgi:hypothetical protein
MLEKGGWARMPFDARSFRLEILKSLVDVGSEAYKENVRINSILEDKAQKTVGLAGVFLAAALAFLKIETLSQWPFNRLRILIPLAVSIALLVCCVSFCLAVMWVRAISGPPTFISLNQLKNDLWSFSGDALEQYEESYWGDRATLWQAVINQHMPLLKSKAKRLRVAHVALALAMLVVAFLLFALVQPIIASHM